MNPILLLVRAGVLVGLLAAVGCSKSGVTPPPAGGCVANGVDTCAAKPAKITFQLGQVAQTMHHFGASDAWVTQWVGKWPAASKEPIAKLLFSSEVDNAGNPLGIALSMWRFNIGDGSKDQANSGYKSASWHKETESFLSASSTYNWNKSAGTKWFMQKAKDYGVPHFTGWITSPPYFMTQNGYTFRTDAVPGMNLPAAKYNDYAAFVAEVAKQFEREGFPLTAVSPFNETQYDWKAAIGDATQSGTYASNKEVADITKLIHQQFTSKAVAAKIIIPESGKLTDLISGATATTNQLESFWNPSSPNYLGNLSTVSKNVAAHSYWTNPSVSVSIQNRRNLLAKMTAVDPALQFWQTEYSVLGTDYLQGGSASQLTEMDYALWIARIIHTDVTEANCSGWSWWSALNNSNFQDHRYRFSLILWTPNVDNEMHTDGSYSVGKNLWMLGNFSRFVRPGMKRVSASIDGITDAVQAGSSQMISAYKDEVRKKLVFVIINTANAAKSYSFNSSLLSGTTVEKFVTSVTKNLQHAIDPLNNVHIEAKSITTVVADYQ